MWRGRWVRSNHPQWPGVRVEPWPLDDESGSVSDGLPVGEGGGTVVRRYLTPESLALPLDTPSGRPDHPMARVGDVLDAHPDVNVELRVDLVPLSPQERDRVCADRLKDLDEDDPDRELWETDANTRRLAGVRVLLRVARAGAGHAAECERVAERICGVLDTFWATEYNGLASRKVSDDLFDQMWESGVVEKDVPVWHWDVLQALLAPPPSSIGKISSRKRLPDPPVLETFNPYSPGGLMPIGIVSEQGKDRMVGVPWGGAADALVDWTVGATGAGKTWHVLSRVVALAETGRGFLFLDPHRTAVADIKQFVGARHADRILEIDLQATNSRGEPISAGWNPLDLTVVPAEMRKGRIDNLKSMLPVGLFPDYCGADTKAPQTATIIRKTLECLLHLNYRLPAQIQASLFCIENLLLDEEWRTLAVAQLPLRDQKWWHHTYPMIVGEKGPSSAALKPALNALEQWKSQDRVQALLGASQNTLRWRDIIDGGKILFVVLNNDGSESDTLLARLMVSEMVAAFKERSLTHQAGKSVIPYHLFLDEFQSCASVLEAQAEVMVQEGRKFGVKIHFINQSPSALTPGTREMIIANSTHLFSGRLGNPADAKSMAEAMGGQQGPRRPNDDQGPALLESRDLLKMPRWHFICQVTQNGELSSAFQLKGIDANQTWAHLRTDRDITDQIIANTGLEPVEQRLDHYDTLPARIAHWLKTGKVLTTEQALQQQHQPPAAIAGPGSQINSSRSPAKTRQPTPDAWANDCLIEDPAAVTPTKAFASSYNRWCKTRNVQPLPDRQLQQHLTRRYGPSEPARINGQVVRVRRGIKLRTPAPVTRT